MAWLEVAACFSTALMVSVWFGRKTYELWKPWADHKRIIFCQKLLLLILDILPSGHPEGIAIAKALALYGKGDTR